MYKVDFGEDKDFIDKYRELKSSRKMGEFYGCNKTSVLNHAKKIGFDVNSVQTYKLTEKDKEEIRQAYNVYTSTELAEKYNVSRGMITKIWYDANLSGKEITVIPAFKDLTNQIFGYMLVLSKTDKRNASGGIVWHCKCLNCGKEKDASGNALQNGSIVSCGCIGRDNLLLGRAPKDRTHKRYGKLIVLCQVENVTLSNGVSQVAWKCRCDCGRETIVLASNLATGNTQSCGLCGNNSHGNNKIEELLIQSNIPFIREKRFEDCRDKNLLPFDFFVNNKYLIEYDGKQHFEDTGLFNYEDTIKHDKIKNQWCKTHNIPLIRIPYTHYKKLSIEDLMLETSPFIVDNADDEKSEY